MTSAPDSDARVAVLIVAAGRGARFGGETPKQYVPVAGICALRRCLATFLESPTVAQVQVVIHPDDRPLYDTAVYGVSDARLLPPVTGGATRVRSVGSGLDALSDHAPDVVLVHDAARAFVAGRIITEVVQALKTKAAAFAALPVVDALWRVDEGRATEPVARDGLWRAQTPQGFRFDVLRQAHAAYTGDAADDVAIVRAAGVTVEIVQGDAANFKITTPDDLARAERFVAGRG